MIYGHELTIYGSFHEARVICDGIVKASLQKPANTVYLAFELDAVEIECLCCGAGPLGSWCVCLASGRVILDTRRWKRKLGEELVASWRPDAQAVSLAERRSRGFLSYAVRKWGLAALAFGIISSGMDLAAGADRGISPLRFIIGVLFSTLLWGSLMSLFFWRLEGRKLASLREAKGR
jgi:hypothetical protein